MLAMMHPFAPLDLLDDVMALDALASTAGCHLSHDAPIVTPHDDRFLISVAAPGVSPADLTVEALVGGRLAVRGRTETEAHTHFVNYTLALPPDADLDSATAEAADGVLTIAVPKRAPAGPARIEVGTVDDERTTEDDDDEDQLVLSVVAAGFAAADLDVCAEGGAIVVRGESKRTGARLARAIRLPRDVEVGAATAVHVDGILTLRVPKKQAAEPKRIAVVAAKAADTDEAVVMV